VPPASIDDGHRSRDQERTAMTAPLSLIHSGLCHRVHVKRGCQRPWRGAGIGLLVLVRTAQVERCPRRGHRGPEQQRASWAPVRPSNDELIHGPLYTLPAGAARARSVQFQAGIRASVSPSCGGTPTSSRDEVAVGRAAMRAVIGPSQEPQQAGSATLRSRWGRRRVEEVADHHSGEALPNPLWIRHIAAMPDVTSAGICPGAVPLR
jgi:hypothetical protein